MDCGSPGDTSEDGCGLLPENQQVVTFFSKWQVLGDKAFDLVQIELPDDYAKDEFATKLMVLKGAMPEIARAQQNRQEAEKKAKEQSTRRQSPRRG